MAARLRRQGLGRQVVLGFGGDVNLGGCIDQSLPNSVPDPSARAAVRRLRQNHPLLARGMRAPELWGDCIGDVGEPSITMVSLISPLTLNSQRSRASSGGMKSVSYRSHPLNVEALVDANVGVVSLANGHILDYREAGLFDTWEALDAAGIRHAGSGVDREDAFRPVIISTMGRKFAFFSISAAGCGLRDAAGQEMWAANERRAGIAHFDAWDESQREEFLQELGMVVKALCDAQRISLVIVSVCWTTHVLLKLLEAVPRNSRPLSRIDFKGG